MTINLLLVDLGSPANIGTIMRHVVTQAGKQCRLYIFDPRDKLTRYAEEIDKTSLGLSKDPDTYELVHDLETLLGTYNGRIITTEVSARATALPKFSFHENDLVLFGNENRGFGRIDQTSWPGIERAQQSVIVPMLGDSYPIPDHGRYRADNYGQFPNFSVSATAFIVLYAALSQLGHFDDFSFNNLIKE
jgi:tRNA(Leu) C34 or U34 (ribose-2'-O)-methylase TrmL